MNNLTKKRREEVLMFLERLRQEHEDNASTIAINEIQKMLTETKYGLVWEEHSEQADDELKTKIPVFNDVKEKKIKYNEQSFNFLLEGDNLHSLNLLEKTHREKIDVVYIDPPYNTGNKDFTYDDAYVEKEDSYRHSKWLSFMYRRLVKVRKLLSKDGIIVISIGHQELHNLVLLCESLFSDKQITTVTVQTSGGKPSGGFNFIHEYLIFITNSDFTPNKMNFVGGKTRSPFEGLTLATFTKKQRPNQTYPIFVDNETMQIVGVGKSLTERIKEGSYNGNIEDFHYDYSEAPDGTNAIWPISSRGGECVWRFIPSRLTNDWEKGYIKVSLNRNKKHPNKFSIQYLPSGIIEKVKAGKIEVLGREENKPTLILGDNKTEGNEIPTIWNEKEFHTTRGTSLIKQIFDEKVFSYPKSLELIVEILRAVSKEDSFVLDFFAGSGTTGHAVQELNKDDKGKRRYILCTNNENNICEEVTYERMKQIQTTLPHNLKYFKTKLVPRISEDGVSDQLLSYVTELIELEHGVDLSGTEYTLVLTQQELELFFEREYEKECETIYLSADILLSRNQEITLEENNVNIEIVPEYYFSEEMREAGEL